MESVTGKVEDLKSSNITTKDGRQVPKYGITVAGKMMSRIGNTPKGLADGDLVTVDYDVNGQFLNIMDIKKNGVSIIPPKIFGGSRDGGKGLIVQAAVDIVIHNAKIANREIKDTDMADIKAIFEELQKLAQ